MAIAMKMYASSSGSLIGVRKRTMDSAPTSPSESANDDFAITSATVSTRKGKMTLNSRRLEKVYAK